MAWYPGAIRRPISKFRKRLTRVRGVCLHVAVSEGSSLYGYFSNASVCSHFYVRRDGTVEQYIDTYYQAPANGSGNSSLISVETQGGVRNANDEPWTKAQLEALAQIAAWANRVHGVPLQKMTNSRVTTKGIGYHRLGVDPWRVFLGEKWSSSRGKICPGQGKILQVPGIIARAIEINKPGLPDTGEDDMPLNTEDVNAVANAVFRKLTSGESGGELVELIRRAVHESPVGGVKGALGYWTTLIKEIRGK